MAPSDRSNGFEGVLESADGLEREGVDGKGAFQLSPSGEHGRACGTKGVRGLEGSRQLPAPSASYPRFGASQRSASWSGIPLRRA